MAAISGPGGQVIARTSLGVTDHSVPTCTDSRLHIVCRFLTSKCGTVNELYVGICGVGSELLYNELGKAGLATQ